MQIDPQLLFQTLTLAAKATNHIEDVFKYELCSYPPALFDTSLMLRESQKSVLANAIWNLLPQYIPGIPGEVQFVLDGGSLFQCIQGATYKDICTAYTEYVTKKYDEAIIVFDSYSESSTKDMVHQRRAKGHAIVTVTFTEDMKLSMKKANFLANSVNKQQFINMLGSYLQKKCKVYRALGDADVLIVQKAVESARVVDTVLIGDDTNLLVLLCYHASLHSHNIFLKPETKKNAQEPSSMEHNSCQTATRP